MNISVVIPWRPDGPDRQAALDYVTGRYERELPDLQVVVGEHPDDGGPWRKALAIRDGMSRTDAKVLVLADADVWCDGLQRAIERVVGGVSSWAIPHTKVIRLSQAATRTVLAGGPMQPQSTARRPYVGISGGGLTVIRRELYEQAPFDARFTGWGHEDQSAGMMWRCLAGEPWRGHADLWHLWHPAQPKLSQAVGSRTSYELHLRYRKASNDPEAMRQLVSEGLEMIQS